MIASQTQAGRAIKSSTMVMTSITTGIKEKCAMGKKGYYYDLFGKPLSSSYKSWCEVSALARGDTERKE